jgi:hypothetical protein
MADFVQSVSLIAPLYNLAFSLIVFILLFRLIKLRRTNRRVFITPWYYFFAAICVFLLEEGITALKFFGIISEAVVPRWFNAVFELIMVTLFIYMLFVQIEHVQKRYR